MSGISQDILISLESFSLSHSLSHILSHTLMHTHIGIFSQPSLSIVICSDISHFPPLTTVYRVPYGTSSAYFSHWLTSVGVMAFCSFTRRTNANKQFPCSSIDCYDNVCLLRPKNVFFFLMFVFLFLFWQRPGSFPKNYALQKHGKTKQALTKSKGCVPTYWLCNTC